METAARAPPILVAGATRCIGAGSARLAAAADGAHGSRTAQTDLTSPPSMRSAEPVIHLAWGDTTNAIRAAISSGSP